MRLTLLCVPEPWWWVLRAMCRRGREELTAFTVCEKTPECKQLKSEVRQ